MAKDVLDYRMPDLPKLPLENAFEDSPQTRLLVGIFEKDTEKLVQYTKTLRKCSQHIIQAQQEVALAIRSLATHLRSYDSMKFPLEQECDTLPSALKEFAVTVDEVGVWYHNMCAQLAESMLAPIHRYLDKDLQEVMTVRDMFQTVSSDRDRVLSRYARASKRPKPELEAERNVAATEVYQTQKKFHQMSLLYYNKLNLIQYSRKMALADPILGFLQALRSFHILGQNCLNSAETETFLSKVTLNSQTAQNEMLSEMSESADLIDAITTQSESVYSVDPGDQAPRIDFDHPPRNIAGYLFYKSRYMGVMSTWERAFFFTEGSNLMMMRRGDVAGGLVLELDHSTITQPLTGDERPAVFQISTNKKTFILQALNDRERDEWLITIHNVVKFGGTAGDRALPPPAETGGRLLSGMSQFLSEHFNVTDKRRESRTSTSNETFISDAPIVFELPWEDGQEGQEEPSAAVPERPETPQKFEALFLGSMEVQADRGLRLVTEVQRQIVAARVAHSVSASMSVTLEIGIHDLRVLEHDSGRLRVRYSYSDISFWASHLHNERLLGFITRFAGGALFCHVYETVAAAQQVCSALTHASASALQRSQDTQLLLKNIKAQPNVDDPVFTPDGRYVILDDPTSDTVEGSPDADVDNGSDKSANTATPEPVQPETEA